MEMLWQELVCGLIDGFFSAQTLAQKSLNESLPLRINFLVPHLWPYFHPDIGTEVPERVPAITYQFFWAPSMVFFSVQTLAQKSLNEFLPSDVHFWGAIYGFIHPDSGREVPERVPATIYQFFGAPSMAFFSAQTLAQKSLNEFLPLYINFLGSHLWRFPPRQWDRSPWTSSCHQMFIFGATSMAFFPPRRWDRSPWKISWNPMCAFGGPSFGRICPDSKTNFQKKIMAQNVYFGAAIFGRIRPGQNFGFQKGIVTKREEQQSTFWESENWDLLSHLNTFQKLLSYSADFGNLSSRGCYCYPGNLSMVDSRTSPVSAQTGGQKSLNEFLPLYINFMVPHLWPFFRPRHWHRSPWTSSCHYISIFWGPIYGVFRPDSGTEAPERVPATRCSFLGPHLWPFFRPDGGTEVLERFPGTQCAFLGAPALAVSAQIVGHISLIFLMIPVWCSWVKT